MRDNNEGTYRTGGKGRHLWPRLVRKVAEGKTSYELSWKVQLMIKKNNNNKLPYSNAALKRSKSHLGLQSRCGHKLLVISVRLRFLYSAALKRLKSREGLQSRFGHTLLGIRVRLRFLYSAALKRSKSRFGLQSRCGDKLLGLGVRLMSPYSALLKRLQT